VARLGRRWGRRRVVQGSMRGAVAFGRLGRGGFDHDGRKGTTGPSGPSGLGALGRPISEKKMKRK
jgi:hypothetical protein